MNPKVDAKFLRRFEKGTSEVIEHMGKTEKLRKAEPLRASRLTKRVLCTICNQAIYPGDMYRDGGRDNRAHDRCVVVQVKG